MVSITNPSVIASIAGTGAAIFMIGLGLFIEKTKEETKSSYFAHYFIPMMLLGIGMALYFMAGWMQDSLE